MIIKRQLKKLPCLLGSFVAFYYPPAAGLLGKPQLHYGRVIDELNCTRNGNIDGTIWVTCSAPGCVVQVSPTTTENKVHAIDRDLCHSMIEASLRTLVPDCYDRPAEEYRVPPGFSCPKCENDLAAYFWIAADEVDRWGTRPSFAAPEQAKCLRCGSEFHIIERTLRGGPQA